MKTQLEDLKQELRDVEKQIHLTMAWTPHSIVLQGLIEKRYKLIDTINNIQ